MAVCVGGVVWGWVLVGGTESVIPEGRGVIVGATESEKPPHASMGSINKIKNRFMLFILGRRLFLHLQRRLCWLQGSYCPLTRVYVLLPLRAGTVR